MQQVITVSLDGNSYQVEENAYDALRKYLNRARNGLRGNPDVDEILGDLERAIAEKCAGAIKPGKNVVSSTAMEQILRDTGPVADDFPGETGPDVESIHAASGKRLTKKRNGAVLGGVATGVAEYFNVDVLIVRVLFAAFSLMTGIGFLIYVVLLIAMPEDPSNATLGFQANAKTSLFRVLTVIAVGLMILLGVTIAAQMGLGLDVDYGDRIFNSPSQTQMWMGRVYAAPVLLFLGGLAVLLGRLFRSVVPLVIAIPILLFGFALMTMHLARFMPMAAFLFLPFAVPLLVIMVVALGAAYLVRQSRSTSR